MSTLRGVVLLVLGTATLTDTVDAQSRPEFTFGVSSTFDSNIFLLRPVEKQDISTLGGSGRFVNMESASDVRTKVSAEATFKTRGIGGNRLRIIPAIDYAFNAQNSARREWELGLSLKQDMPHEGRLRLRGSFMPHSFRKNYLSAAVDSNGDGAINLAERVYVPGSYLAASVGLDFRFRVAEWTKTIPFGAFLRFGVGYDYRTYSLPLGARDRSGPTGTLSLTLALAPRIAVDLEYGFASLNNTAGPVLLLIDELKIGQDLNQNGSITDQDVRVWESVDRSHVDRSVGATLHIDFIRLTKIDFGFQARVRTFSSQEPLDVGHNGRIDMRHRLEVEVDRRIAPRVRGTLGVTYTSQTINRELDLAATGDIADYSRALVRLGLKFRT